MDEQSLFKMLAELDGSDPATIKERLRDKEYASQLCTKMNGMTLDDLVACCDPGRANHAGLKIHRPEPGEEN